MHKGRLEAFSDGVIAILITIMVLELKVPHGADPGALLPLVPVFVSYVLSFFIMAIWWNNHHHMLQAAQRIDGRALWANMHLLFWMSLMPFTTAWMGENEFAPIPVAVYGIDLVFSSIAYYVLAHTLVRIHGRDSAFATALGSDRKGRISTLLYVVAVPLVFVSPWISILIYAAVAGLWLVPDRRFAEIAGK